MYGVAVSILGAFELSEFLDSGRTQTADSYYFQVPGIATFHVLGLAVVALSLLCLATWIAMPKFAPVLRVVVVGLAMFGFALVWAELARATVIRDPRFLLESLPFRPINNLGLIGANVFGGYMLLKLPAGLLRPFPATVIKLTFVAGLVIVQLMIYETAGAGLYA